MPQRSKRDVSSSVNSSFSGESPRHLPATFCSGAGLAVALQHAGTLYNHGESRAKSMDISIVLRRLA